MKKRSLFISVLGLTIFVSGCNNSEPDQYTEEQISQVEHPSKGEFDSKKDRIDQWKYIVERKEKEEKESEEREKQQETEEPNIPEDIKITFQNGEFFLPKEYFNILKTVNGEKTIQNPNNILVMANKSLYLPSTFKPADLVQPDVPFVFKGASQNYMRKIAADALEKMFAAAKNDGIKLIARSGFRSYQTQKIVFDREVAEVGYDKAILAVAKPGTSEHQTGLTMDITANSVNQQLVEKFGETKEGKWLRDHAHEFGFILRYPKGKEDITGYMYEPWHFRYVGKEAAKIIYENNWTLEEFFNVVKEI